MEGLSKEDICLLMQQNEALKKQNDALLERVRPSTLLEYLRNCHSHMYTKFKVQPNSTLTTKDGLTSVTNKNYPVRVKSWSGFLEEQREMFGIVMSMLADKQLFESSELTAGYGARLDRYIGSERDLERFFHTAVEEPVRIISQAMVANKDHLEIPPELGLVGGVEFENHINILNEEGGFSNPREVQIGTDTPPMATPQTPPDQRDPSPEPSAKALRPDQIYVYKTYNESGNGKERRVLAFVEEYKSPAKLRNVHIRAALGDKPLSIIDIINKIKIPHKDDVAAHFGYVARRMTAMALTQVYHYMLQAGIERGVMTTGEVIVFLRIDWNDSPNTLLYHVAEPRPETAARPEDLPYSSATGQLLAFTLSALTGNGPRGQDERDPVIRNAPVWEADWEQILHQLKHDKVDSKPPPSSEDRYRPTTYREFDRSPIYLRKKKLVKYYKDSSPNVAPSRREDDRHSSDEGDDGVPRDAALPRARKRSPTSPLARRAKAARSQSGQSHSQQQGQNTQQKQADNEWKKLPYCSHKCLQGLVVGGLLDPACPNVALHRSQSHENDAVRHRHTISHAEFKTCLAEQMRRTLDNGITPLPQVGARGVLFRIVLLEYGYTFVAKGTRSGLTVHLRHEAQVYARLQSLQGVCVPVCLGTVDLRDVGRCYYYDITTQIIFFVFLSWAGVSAHDSALSEERKDKLISRQADWAMRCIHALGVRQNDMSDANTMWDDATGRVMIIDFERAILLLEPCHPVQAKRPPIYHNEVLQKRRKSKSRIHGNEEHAS